MGRAKRKRKNRYCIAPLTLLRGECARIDFRAILIGGVVVTVLALFCRIAVGSPLYVRHLLRLPDCMPSSICLYLVGGLLFFLLGALFGALVSAPSNAVIRARFHGLIFLVPLTLFRLFWYPLLFGAVSAALAMMSLALAALAGVCALMKLWRVFRLACPILIAQLLWILWLFYATLWVLFLN